ncbi:hypothetical protein CFIMG_004332RA [Ceratocystis fimbriata CBS 114723]|uniref:DUF7053 domain-containing protein n=1 Tax=Ceratocystis fimbriata CBS 114723 TaxID=1035309 RepID=A0A2C5WZJ4_9PEZI|nr:hypothetical protein CFIMG_004332RA [Ceratocystis fimbriata CBS 114723]
MSRFMQKKDSFTIITPIPSFIPRQLALDIIHSHSEIITLNPLVLSHTPIAAPRDAAADEYYSTWYEITERIQYVPGMGALGSGKISFKGCFHDTTWGLQTHIYAPMGIDLRNTYRIAGNEPGERPEPAELGLLSLGAPRDGLYLREDIVIRCNITLMGFVRGQMKAASKQVVQRFIKKAELLDAGALQAMFENGRLRTLNPKDLSDVAAQANIARGQTTSYSRPESMAPRSASMSPRPESMSPRPASMSPRPEIMLLRQASMSPHPAPMSLGPTNAIMQMPPPYQMPVEMPGDFTYRTFSGQAEDQAEQRVEFPHGTLNDCSFSARLSQAARLSPALPPMPLALQESKYQPEMVEIRRDALTPRATIRSLRADSRGEASYWLRFWPAASTRPLHSTSPIADARGHTMLSKLVESMVSDHTATSPPSTSDLSASLSPARGSWAYILRQLLVGVHQSLKG